MLKQRFFLRAKKIDIQTGSTWIVAVHCKDSDRYGIRAGDELILSWKNKETSVIADITTKLVEPGQVGLFGDILEHYKIKNEELIELNLAGRPKSIKAIQKKLLGKTLSYREIYSIMSDISSYKLDDAEIAFFTASAYMKNGFSRKELYYAAKAMAYTGRIFNFGKIVADKHSIGGLPGNRTTPIVVAIIASYGIIIPKTSSRSITSAAGTADTFEVLAPVTFTGDEVQRLVKKVGACLVWGAEKIAPADDIIIRASYHLGLESYTKMAVSIMAKKVATGITHLVLDIPVGPTTKISNLSMAEKVKNTFLYLAKQFKIKMRIVIHKARGPVGRGVGAALEARDVLRVLQQKDDRPRDLEEKAVWLAGNLLELVKLAKKGTGSYLARKSLINGKAWIKMQEIIRAQGGRPLDSEKIKIGNIRYTVRAKNNGKIVNIHNKNLVEICRLLGAPGNKKAGIYLHKIIGETIKKNDILFTLYTDNQLHLNLARTTLKKLWIYKIK